MKAYIIKIELLDSYPVIWRRVVMPADATFRRLHDVIQTVTNFLSGGSYGGYHLYEFDLSAENITVTNDEESFEEYQYYKQNKKQYEERLRLAPIGSFQRSSLERLMKTVVRQPSRIKIDKYLEKYKEIRYSYDFGDGWEFLITLEQTVDDYHFGYPTLLDGAESAPPEDVGGLGGFEEFLEIYRDPSHPEYAEMKEWADSQEFREYDPDWINNSLKYLNYKKTEWDQINHDNYFIIEDKYRKN